MVPADSSTIHCTNSEVSAAHPVEARLHRLGQHQHENQQLGEQDEAEQGLGLAQLGHENHRIRQWISQVQPGGSTARQFPCARTTASRVSGCAGGIMRKCQPAHPSPTPAAARKGAIPAIIAAFTAFGFQRAHS